MDNHEIVSSDEWDEEDVDPLNHDLEEDGYDIATHGGGELENVPDYDFSDSLTQGLEEINDDENLDLEILPPPCEEDGCAAEQDADQLEPVDGQAEIVFGRDDRVRIKNTTALPWRMICVLIITWPNGKRSRCTGFFIGPHTVVTAGHCVYSHANRGWAKKILVIPGMKDRNTRPYGAQAGRSFRSVKGWIKKKRKADDYGCIILPNNKLGNKVGHFGFAALSTRSLKRLLVNNAGYPSDKPFGMWYNAGRITRVLARQIFYKLDTYRGQSGGPVWRRRSGKLHVVGIHNYGGNKATRITKTVYNNMMKWKK